MVVAISGWIFVFHGFGGSVEVYDIEFISKVGRQAAT